MKSGDGNRFGGWRSFTRAGRAVAATAGAYKRVFASPDGKQVLDDLARATRYFEIADSGSAAEHNAMRSVYQHVLSMLAFTEADLRQLAEADYAEQLEMSHE
ncbi:hypothetical protein [Aestuariispira insulae]|uniref:Bbp19-like phage domain-containing protein n=1 Tax=Aestuariispira insulae TaxID=1461337 RepID=A0A3D9HRU8_9PROT|nr:hypothetical protein [Aestuariispira insulae]RED52179.1 hypothetical protein DFP90_102197 [Aestuariispira insulae]